MKKVGYSVPHLINGTRGVHRAIQINGPLFPWHPCGVIAYFFTSQLQVRIGEHEWSCNKGVAFINTLSPISHNCAAAFRAAEILIHIAKTIWC